MKNFKNSLIAISAICMAAVSAVAPMSASAAQTTDSAVSESISDVAYEYTVDGDSFSFYDNVHSISIVDGTLKDGKDISFYGLNEQGDLAVVSSMFRLMKARALLLPTIQWFTLLTLTAIFLKLREISAQMICSTLI